MGTSEVPALGDFERASPTQPLVPPSGGQTPFEPRWPPLQTRIDHYEIAFDEATAAIVYDPITARQWSPGQFMAEGAWRDAEVRRRGDGALSQPKHSWKVKLPRGERYLGARRFNYLAEWLDAGYLTDMFSYRLMAAAGVHAPRPRYVTLSVNSEIQGIYTQLEQVDGSFVRNHGLEPGASVYRCGSKDCEMKITPPAHYQKPFSKKTNEELPFDDLDDFLWRLSRTPEHQLEAFLQAQLDLDRFLRLLAVYALISAHGIDDSGSYLIHELQADRWHYSPWDLNNSRMQYWRTERLDARPRVNRAIPVYTVYDPETVKTYYFKEQKYGGAHRPFSVLNQRVWDRPALRTRVLDHLERLMATVFTTVSAGAEIDALHALLEPELPRDPWVDQPHAIRAPGFLKEYVAGRIAFLQGEIPRERHRGEGGVVLNAIGAAGGSARDDRGEADGFVELYNREDTPLAVGGMTITDAIREEFKHVLPAGLVVPPRGTLVLWADGQVDQGDNHLPFTISLQGGELAIYDGQNRDGLIDLTFYAPFKAGQVYARSPNGSEDWGWRTP